MQVYSAEELEEYANVKEFDPIMQSKHHKAIDEEFDVVVRNGSIVSNKHL